MNTKNQKIACDLREALNESGNAAYTGELNRGSLTVLDGAYDLEKVAEILGKKWKISGRTDP